MTFVLGSRRKASEILKKSHQLGMWAGNENEGGSGYQEVLGGRAVIRARAQAGMRAGWPCAYYKGESGQQIGSDGWRQGKGDGTWPRSCPSWQQATVVALDDMRKAVMVQASLLVKQMLPSRPIWHTEHRDYWMGKIESRFVSQKVEPWAAKSLCPFAQVTYVLSSSFFLPSWPHSPQRRKTDCQHVPHFLFSLCLFWPLLLFFPTCSLCQASSLSFLPNLPPSGSSTSTAQLTTHWPDQQRLWPAMSQSC